jgi:alpha/beta superfamily hydrolase
MFWFFRVNFFFYKKNWLFLNLYFKRSGNSEGQYVTMGANETLDAKVVIDYVRNNYPHIDKYLI